MKCGQSERVIWGYEMGKMHLPEMLCFECMKYLEGNKEKQGLLAKGIGTVTSFTYLFSINLCPTIVKKCKISKITLPQTVASKR